MADDEPKERKKPGPVTWEPTDEQRNAVIVHKGNGATNDLIALMLGVSEDSLTRHCGDELANAKPRAIAIMAGKLWQMAMAGNIAAVIFWLKSQAGWSEKVRVEKSWEAKQYAELLAKMEGLSDAALAEIERVLGAEFDVPGGAGHSAEEGGGEGLSSGIGEPRGNA